jgi:hypothetical protein
VSDIGAIRPGCDAAHRAHQEVVTMITARDRTASSTRTRRAPIDSLDVVGCCLDDSLDALIQQVFAAGLELHVAAAIVDNDYRATARIDAATSRLDHIIDGLRETAAAHGASHEWSPWR